MLSLNGSKYLYIHRPKSKDGTIFRARYILYSYMDPLG